MARGEDVLLERAGGEVARDLGIDARGLAALDAVLCDEMSIECGEEGRGGRTAGEASIGGIFDADVSSDGGRVNAGSMSDYLSYS